MQSKVNTISTSLVPTAFGCPRPRPHALRHYQRADGSPRRPPFTRSQQLEHRSHGDGQSVVSATCDSLTTALTCCIARVSTRSALTSHAEARITVVRAQTLQWRRWVLVTWPMRCVSRPVPAAGPRLAEERCAARQAPVVLRGPRDRRAGRLSLCATRLQRYPRRRDYAIHVALYTSPAGSLSTHWAQRAWPRRRSQWLYVTCHRRARTGGGRPAERRSQHRAPARSRCRSPPTVSSSCVAVG